MPFGTLLGHIPALPLVCLVSVYMLAILVFGSTAVFSKSPQRRRDALKVFQLLLPRPQPRSDRTPRSVKVGRKPKEHPALPPADVGHPADRDSTAEP